MSESIPAQRRSKRALAAKIAGIAGIVVCAAIIVLLWLGRGAVAGAIDGLASDVSSGFDRAIAATDAVAGRLDDAASNVGAIASDASELASSSSPPPERLAALQARLGEAADRYRDLRVRYSEAKESLSSVGATMRSIREILPGTRVPEAPIGLLAGVDERLQAVDERLTDLWTSLEDGQPAAAAAEAVAERASTLQATVSDAAEAAHGVSANLETARADAANAIGGIQSVITIAVLAITLLLLWVLLLNVALWLLGRTWQREAMATAPAALAGTTAQPPPDAPAPEPPSA